MELVNLMQSLLSDQAEIEVSFPVVKKAVETTLLLLYPMTPHFCSELWELTGHTTPLENHIWPTFDPESAKEEKITIVLQVNGKVRSRLQVAPDTGDDEIKQLTLQDAKVQKFVADNQIKKIIIVPKKLVNVVI
jgi:leucyl-tRNA synthetase